MDYMGQTVTYTVTLLQMHVRSSLVGNCFWEPSTPNLWVTSSMVTSRIREGHAYAFTLIQR